MTQRVIQADEISLNSVRYPIEGPVQTVLASIYPSKVVLGDTTKTPSYVLLWLPGLTSGAGSALKR